MPVFDAVGGFDRGPIITMQVAVAVPILGPVGVFYGSTVVAMELAVAPPFFGAVGVFDRRSIFSVQLAVAIAEICAVAAGVLAISLAGDFAKHAREEVHQVTCLRCRG